MSKRILVVEDQEDNRQIIRDMLTFRGTLACYSIPLPLRHFWHFQSIAYGRYDAAFLWWGCINEASAISYCCGWRDRFLPLLADCRALAVSRKADRWGLDGLIARHLTRSNCGV